jgi:hypothetical protein
VRRGVGGATGRQAGQAQAAGEEQQLLCGEEAVALVSGCRVKPSKKCQVHERGYAGGLCPHRPVIIGPQGLLRARGA